jgi:two-component system chemotaxis sensor kinase CheA
VDKTVIERLADPMIHLIRNSAITVWKWRRTRRFGQTGDRSPDPVGATGGGEVLIAITDDGRGINRARARQGRIARPDPAWRAVGDAELFQMIFHPGFSTAAAITNLSGRGGVA